MYTNNEKKGGITGRKKPQQSCDSCEFYSYDDEYDAYTCNVNLDQDERADFVSGRTNRCPYYRYYDEYKSVHRQI
ncbi:MAG: DUF6472 family protein [Eubacteriales bacterium]